MIVTRDELWTFRVDRGLRRRLFSEKVFSHPAKLHLGLLQKLISMYTCNGETLLDPMAGTGSLMLAAIQRRNVILRDLQPEYVALMQVSVPSIHRASGLFNGGLIDIDQADAKTLDCPPFNHAIFSPPYGLETSGDDPEVLRRRAERLAKNVGTSRRWQQYITDPYHASFANGFRYKGGQENAGNKSGRNYWGDMRLIYARIVKLLPSGGLMILILKNHYRRGVLRDIVRETVVEVEKMGMQLVARHGRFIDNPSLWQRRRKEQGLPIVEIEDVLVFRKENT